MEKSIETIWKEGFLQSDALVAPKLIDIYNQRSMHLVDKFKRMFRINLIALVIGSIVFLVISFFIGIPVMGVGYFLVLSVIVVVNRRLSKGLDRINKNANSYEYLKEFDSWIKEQLSVNRRMARFYYPLFFLFLILGLWSSSDFQALLAKFIVGNNDMLLVGGIPVLWTIPVVIVAGLLGIYGGRIYNWDVSVVYGVVFKKLEEILADMEALRAYPPTNEA